MKMPLTSEDNRLPDVSRLPAIEVDPRLLTFTDRVSTGSSSTDEGSIAEYGRTYHHYKPDNYLLPNDTDEQDRLDLQHKVTVLIMNEQLCWAPLDLGPNSSGRALDIGTGTGIWPNEFAKQNPHWHVTGSDLSLIQPAGKVSNCDFIREDAQEDEWTFNEQFDYIHFRHFCAFVTDIREVLRKAYSQLKPGGWIEGQEITHEIASPDDTFEGTSQQAASRILTNVGASRGCNPWAMVHLKDIFTELGFVDVTEKILALPIGSWAADPRLKRIGALHAANCKRGVESIIKVIMAAGHSMREAQKLIEDCKADIDSGKVHTCNYVYVVYGRKPLSAPSRK